MSGKDLADSGIVEDPIVDPGIVGVGRQGFPGPGLTLQERHRLEFEMTNHQVQVSAVLASPTGGVADRHLGKGLPEIAYRPSELIVPLQHPPVKLFMEEDRQKRIPIPQVPGMYREDGVTVRDLGFIDSNGRGDHPIPKVEAL